MSGAGPWLPVGHDSCTVSAALFTIRKKLTRLPPGSTEETMQYTLPDGTVIEVGSGSNLPPGARGQHVSMGYPWFRINGGEWQKTQHRSAYKLREWIQLCETLADFLEGEATHRDS